MNAAQSALQEYANPRNWRATPEGWVYLDDEPWGRAADALAKEADPEVPD